MLNAAMRRPKIDRCDVVGGNSCVLGDRTPCCSAAKEGAAGRALHLRTDSSSRVGRDNKHDRDTFLLQITSY